MGAACSQITSQKNTTHTCLLLTPCSHDTTEKKYQRELPLWYFYRQDYSGIILSMSFSPALDKVRILILSMSSSSPQVALESLAMGWKYRSPLFMKKQQLRPYSLDTTMALLIRAFSSSVKDLALPGCHLPP